MELKPLHGNDKAWIWIAKDCSDGDPKDEQFCINFVNIETATKFKEVIDINKKQNTTIKAAQPSTTQTAKQPSKPEEVKKPDIQPTTQTTASQPKQPSKPVEPAKKPEIQPTKTTKPTEATTAKKETSELLSLFPPPSSQITSPTTKTEEVTYPTNFFFGAPPTPAPEPVPTPSVPVTAETVSKTSTDTKKAIPKPEEPKPTPAVVPLEAPKPSGQGEPPLFSFSWGKQPELPKETISLGFQLTTDKTEVAGLSWGTFPTANVATKMDSSLYIQPSIVFGETQKVEPKTTTTAPTPTPSVETKGTQSDIQKEAPKVKEAPTTQKVILISDSDDEHPDLYQQQTEEEQPIIVDTAPKVVEVNGVSFTLSLQEKKNYEENENIAFISRAKLYRWDKEGKEWKERGTGDVKILEHKATGKARLLMRRDRVLTICANHPIISSMEMKEMKGNEKAWTWIASDLSEGKAVSELFYIRFLDRETAVKFKAQFDVSKMKNVVTNAGSGTAAEGKPQDVPQQTQNQPKPQTETKPIQTQPQPQPQLQPQPQTQPKPQVEPKTQTQTKSTQPQTPQAQPQTQPKPTQPQTQTQTPQNQSKTQSLFQISEPNLSSMFSENPDWKLGSLFTNPPSNPTTPHSATSKAIPISPAFNALPPPFTFDPVPHQTFSFTSIESSVVSPLTDLSSLLLPLEEIQNVPSQSQPLGEAKLGKAIEFQPPNQKVNIDTKTTFSFSQNFNQRSQELKQSQSQPPKQQPQTGKKEVIEVISHEETTTEESDGESEEIQEVSFVVDGKTVVLPKQEVKSMEEDEEVLFNSRAKLFRWEKEWKERGTGEVKILKHRVNSKVRVLMRRDKVLNICANHYLFPAMELKPLQGNDKAWIWIAKDCSDGDPKDEQFCMKFVTVENATEFKTVFDKFKGAKPGLTPQPTQPKPTQLPQAQPQSQSQIQPKPQAQPQTQPKSAQPQTPQNQPPPQFLKPQSQTPKVNPKPAPSPEKPPSTISPLFPVPSSAIPEARSEVQYSYPSTFSFGEPIPSQTPAVVAKAPSTSAVPPKQTPQKPSITDIINNALATSPRSKPASQPLNATPINTKVSQVKPKEPVSVSQAPITTPVNTNIAQIMPTKKDGSESLSTFQFNYQKGSSLSFTPLPPIPYDSSKEKSPETSKTQPNSPPVSSSPTYPPTTSITPYLSQQVASPTYPPTPSNPPYLSLPVASPTPSNPPYHSLPVTSPTPSNPPYLAQTVKSPTPYSKAKSVETPQYATQNPAHTLNKATPPSVTVPTQPSKLLAQTAPLPTTDSRQLTVKESINRKDLPPTTIRTEEKLMVIQQVVDIMKKSTAKKENAVQSLEDRLREKESELKIEREKAKEKENAWNKEKEKWTQTNIALASDYKKLSLHNTKLDERIKFLEKLCEERRIYTGTTTLEELQSQLAAYEDEKQKLNQNLQKAKTNLKNTEEKKLKAKDSITQLEIRRRKEKAAIDATKNFLIDSDNDFYVEQQREITNLKTMEECDSKIGEVHQLLKAEKDKLAEIEKLDKQMSAVRTRLNSKANTPFSSLWK